MQQYIYIFIFAFVCILLIYIYGKNNGNNGNESTLFDIYIAELNKYINVHNNVAITITDKPTGDYNRRNMMYIDKTYFLYEGNNIPIDYELIANNVMLNNETIFSIWKPIFNDATLLKKKKHYKKRYIKLHEENKLIIPSVIMPTIHKPQGIPCFIIDAVEHSSKLITYFKISGDTSHIILFYIINETLPYFVKRNIDKVDGLVSKHELFEEKNILHISLL